MEHIKGIIFDLDETLIDTKSLKQFRDRGQWKSCYENVKHTIHFDNGEILLDYLSKSDLKISIVTNSPRKYAETVLKYHNISYEILVAYHDCKPRKPHPAPIFMCAEQMGHPLKNIIGIGDDIRDITAYKNAGIYAIGVSWGVSPGSDLKLAGADIVVDSQCEIIDVLKSFGVGVDYNVNL
ncbi:HAD family hydrolase [Cytobacillus sp. FSL H8-0458]|uniref:HAD family hydrolase n=1 Tax=Cytobacillus sp. FSL H8-0458 TaxID=2975346 RepID=UPI0030FA7BB4